MALFVNQKYAINNDRRRAGSEVGIARMARDGRGDTWAMSPETAEKLGWALIIASREFLKIESEACIDTAPAPLAEDDAPAPHDR